MVNIKINSNNIIDILNLIKKESSKKFIESIDVAINLLIDVSKSDQIINNTVLLPCGHGKKFKIVVFASNLYEKEAYNFGAYYVGTENLFKKIKEKKIKFDLVISSVDYIDYIKKLGVILGPRNLIPNIKLGTLIENNKLIFTIKNFVKNQIIYRNDKFGIIHVSIGNTNFSNSYLIENFKFLINFIKNNKPLKIKSLFFIKKVVLSSTMGKGFIIDINNL